MTKEIKIDPYGFREYDARWLYEKDIDQTGIENLGKGLVTQIINHTKKSNPRVIVGHDYRSETMMRLGGWSETRRGLANAVFAVLCPLAAILFYLGFSGPIASVLPAALGFSAGAFICIALADLLPEVQFHSHDRLKLTASFAVGLMIALALGVLEPHYHQ